MTKKIIGAPNGTACQEAPKEPLKNNTKNLLGSQSFPALSETQPGGLDTILQRAYSLADRGFRLFPIRPNSKLPCLKMWPDEATTDKKTLSIWFGDTGSFKDTQLGICPGNDFFVIDVDNKKDGSGFTNLELLQDTGLPKTFTVKTPSGGLHLYYRKPDKNFVVSRVNWKPGIDIRGNRGQVVAPGSTFKGNRYEILFDMDLTDYPAALYSDIPIKNGTANSVAKSVIQSEFETSPYDTIPDVVAAGGRDATFWGFSCSWRTRGFPYVMAEIRMQELHSKCEQPAGDEFTLDEAIQKLDRAYAEYLPNQKLPSKFHGECYANIQKQIETKRTSETPHCSPGSDPNFIGILLDQMIDLSPEYQEDLLQQIKKASITGMTIPRMRKQLDNQIKEKKRQRDIATAVPAETILAAPPPVLVQNLYNLCCRYIYLKVLDLVYDRCTGELCSLSSMARAHSSQLPGIELGNIIKDFLDSPNSIKVDGMTYWPGDSNGLIHYNGKVLINTYRPSPLQPIAGDPTPWLELGKWLIPDEAEFNHIIDWQAYTLQFPGVKINNHPMVAGAPRIGKDTWFLPFKHALGLHNCIEIGAETLLETYQDYMLNRKLITVQETQNFEKNSVENKLKPMLASPPEELNIRLFNKGFIQQPNIQIFIFFSNHRNALKISQGDGRIFAVWCAPKTPKLDEYYLRFYAWLHEEDGMEIVADYLLNRNVEHFNPSAPAPMTKFKRDIIGLGKTNLEMRLQDLIDKNKGPFAVDVITANEVQKYFDGTEPQRSPTIKAIVNTLAEMGAEKHSFMTGPKDERKNHRVWIIRNTEEWLKKSGSKFCCACNKQRKDRLHLNQF